MGNGKYESCQRSPDMKITDELQAEIESLKHCITNDENWRRAYYDRAIKAEANLTAMQALLRSILYRLNGARDSVSVAIIAECNSALAREHEK